MNTNSTILADAAAPAAPEGQGAGASPWGGLLMPLILIALFYFMFLRPQNRREKERRKMIEELRAGTKVVFGGGIIGTISSANERTFIVDTADGQMEILRSAVQSVVTAEGPSEPAK